MDKWAQGFSEKLKARLKEKQLTDAKFIEVQGIKKNKGPSLWEAVKVAIDKKCAALNAEMGEEIVIAEHPNSKSTVIRATLGIGSYSANIQFDPDRDSLYWQAEHGTPNGRYDLVVNDYGTCQFEESEKKPLREPRNSPDSIAETIIATLLLSKSDFGKAIR